MHDSYGRDIDYMRVSITDRCNLRCRYCMPEAIRPIPSEEILSLEEIVEICRQAAAAGIDKVKITGGEPLVRRDCIKLIQNLKAIPEIQQVTLTTNGVLLSHYAEALSQAGLDAVNVSLDTLHPKKYAAITGSDVLADVLYGISEAEKYRLPLKINAVLQSDLNRDDWQSLTELARNRSIDVRFIEMMPIGYGRQFPSISNDWLLEQLQASYGPLCPESAPHGNGPAIYYHIRGFQGSIGFISALHGKFCHRCNRIRLTASGLLKPCLCYSDAISLKEAVRQGDTKGLQRLLSQAISCKPSGHSFEDNNAVTEQQQMVRIGG